MVRQVQPLRISKSGDTPTSTPNKMAASRPLAEISSGSQRRNSPSYNQATRKMIVSRDSSPFSDASSPFTGMPSPHDRATSPRLDFNNRMSPFRFDENTPDRSPSPSVSPKRRSSIERLKQASRVKNSNIFALENKDAYDPNSTPIVERPTANRPLSQQLANNSFTRFDSFRKENSPLRSPHRPHGHKRSETEINVPRLSPTKEAAGVPLPASPEKHASPSPTKSSMSRTSMFGLSQNPLFDPENGTWSDEERVPTPRGLRRHNKSVTFPAEPPMITEYEQQTPEPSVSVGSREGSWDSEELEEQDYSFDRGSSVEQDRDDSFDEDLENTDKTPVVLPEDWRRMSPDNARTDLVYQDDDVFDGTPSPSPQRPVLGRSESVASDGSSRPLPPLPAFMTQNNRRDSSGSLSAAAERASHAARNLPSPPQPALYSKDSIMNMALQSSLSFQDRLEMLGDHTGKARSSSKSSEETEHAMPEELTVTNLDTGAKMEVQVQVAEAAVEDDTVAADLTEFASAAPRISRESILRKVRNTKYDFEDESDGEESMLDAEEPRPRPTYAELAQLDPDQPVQSRENSRETSETYLDYGAAAFALTEPVEEVHIKAEPIEDDGIDMDAIPTMSEQALQPPRSPSRMDDYERQSSVLHHRIESESADEDDDASRYSSVEPEAQSTMLHDAPQQSQAAEDEGKESLQDAMQLLTVKDYSQPQPSVQQSAKRAPRQSFGLPAYMSSNDYDFGLSTYITPSPPASSDSHKRLDLTAAPSLQPTYQPQHPADIAQQMYLEAEVSPPGTPDSVVQHRTSDVSSLSEQLNPQIDAESIYEEPSPEPEPEVVIPERRATIKTGGKLKARPSISRSDLEAIGQRSGEEPMPAIPNAYLDQTQVDAEEGSVYSTEQAASHVEEKPASRRQSRKMLNLDIPQLSAGAADDLGLGLETAFERVIESQKKGYLMRQNTKVVVASNRNFSNDSNGTNKSADSNATAVPMSPTFEGRPPRATRSAGNSPRKPSAEQFLKTEPWNGKIRRKSMRIASAQKTTYTREPAPPMPGQESVALDVVDEDYAAGTSNLDDEIAEGAERGRLFVKVVGVKELELPMPRNDRLYFQLTLDNGLHCVTTADLELGKSASIGQEFELVVQEDLEFQLTLTTKLPPPPKAPTTPTPSSPTKSVRSEKRGGFAARFLSSPKKRAERERQDREAAETEDRRLREEEQRKRASFKPTAWDMLHDLVNASDGSFARSYVNLKGHEKQCFGRALTVDVPCYNEWALEKDNHVVNSVRSKRGTHTGPIRRPPYVVGKLELQLLYVPKPKGVVEEAMPKSMGAALREMGRAGEVAREVGKEVGFEGCLSQQGGDCTHWRRRFFRLQASRLTAYHEHTHQKRAVINLAKASRLVDDKTTLVSDPNTSNNNTTAGGKKRRKSAFAEEDEGYQYVEEGFRIRFANGETIDFYADSAAEKDGWMEVLAQVVGKPVQEVKKGPSRWTDLVLARERAAGAGATVASSDSALPSSSSSPSKIPPSTSTLPGATEAQDFAPGPAQAQRRESVRRPVPNARSAPTSPVKGPPMQRAPPLPTLAPAPAPRPATAGNGSGAGRSRTPPMGSRSGHRRREQVKSMIF